MKQRSECFEVLAQPARIGVDLAAPENRLSPSGQALRVRI